MQICLEVTCGQGRLMLALDSRCDGRLYLQIRTAGKCVGSSKE